MSMKQILLKGPGYSGRGVRIALLQPDQVDTIREESAKALPPGGDEDDTSAEARQQVWISSQKKAGIAAMVVEITDIGVASKDELLKAAWKKVGAQELLTSPEKYFTPKDLDALGALYFRLHVASQKEVDSILGEALDVTAD